MIPKRSGFKRRGRATEAVPFSDGTLKSVDAAATRSLKGEGKNKMAATYGVTRFNRKPKSAGS